MIPGNAAADATVGIIQVVEDEFRNIPAAAGMHEGLDGLALAWASPESEEGIPTQSQDTNGHQQPGESTSHVTQ